MAHFSFSVTAPANTAKLDYISKYLVIDRGVIHNVDITIPNGHAGLAHLQIFFHEVQLYPLSRGETYHGDGMKITFKDFFEISTEPYMLEARAWNLDDTYDHEFIFSVGVLPMWVVLPQLFTQGLSKTLSKLKGMIIDEEV